MKEFDLSVKVNKVGKEYLISEKTRYLALRDIFVKFLKLPVNLMMGKKFKKKATFWALKGVDFEVKQGEIVGIIGRNGAGKSTLLKILSRITDPTEGDITYKGRVASLLEVGTGFHPELTGRENVFLNGSILGMSRKEIAAKFNEIVDFAGVREFIDMPVKRYSSGMQVRLAFSVAAHLEADIMIIDEVLAVGDAEFQRKCLGKMDEITKEDNRTVFFVSHDMNAIQRLCSKVIWLEQGKVVKYGRTDEVVSEYMESINKSNTDLILENNREKPVKITRVRITDSSGNPKSNFYVGGSFSVLVEYHVNKPNVICNSAVILDSTSGTRVFSSDSYNYVKSEAKPKNIGLYRAMFHFPAQNLMPLNSNSYLLRVSIGMIGSRPDDSVEGIVITFTNNGDSDIPQGGKNDLVLVKPKWEITEE